MKLKNLNWTMIAGIVLLSVVWRVQAAPVVSESTLKKIQKVYGTQASQDVAQWNNLLQTLADQDIQQQLSEVNNFFNRQKFVDDIVHWNKEDYWATPIEFIATGGGDCEDFSIAKYFSLRALGVPANKLRLMYVNALEYNQAHMVLAYYEQPNVIPLVLDNLNKTILPANQRRDLQPVYSFNGEGLWAAKEQGRGKQLQNGGNHSLWRDLTSRMNLEKNNEE